MTDAVEIAVVVPDEPAPIAVEVPAPDTGELDFRFIANSALIALLEDMEG